MRRRHAAEELVTPQPLPRRVEPATGLEDLAAERRAARELAATHRLELADLRTIAPEPAATALLDEVSARRWTAIPLALNGNGVIVAIAEPADAAISALRNEIGRPLVVQIAAPSDILRVIDLTYRALTGVDSRVKAFEAEETPKAQQSTVEP